MSLPGAIRAAVDAALIIEGITAISSEQETLEGLRAGSPESTERFVRQHVGWMRALALRMVGDSGLADDCVQEAFIKAFRGVGAFEGRSSLKTWLHRITVNEALMKLRSVDRRREDPIDDLLPEFDQNHCRIEPPWGAIPTPSELLEQKSTRDLVAAKIRDLPEDYRIVLQLRDIEEMTTAEVADLVGISEGNVKVRLHRARAALKRLLEPILRGEQA